MRGLKPLWIEGKLILPMSHLLQMRGLKHDWMLEVQTYELVASFTDAWIETLKREYTNLF